MLPLSSHFVYQKNTRVRDDKEYQSKNLLNAVPIWNFIFSIGFMPVPQFGVSSDFSMRGK